MILLISQTGCSQNPVSTAKPENTHQQNTQKLNLIGMHRSEFLNKLNAPVVSKLVGDKRIDTITYYPNTSNRKAKGGFLYNSLVAVYVAAPLQEIVSIPKSAIYGQPAVVLITYDSSDYIEKIERIQ